MCVRIRRYYELIKLRFREKDNKEGWRSVERSKRVFLGSGYSLGSALVHFVFWILYGSYDWLLTSYHFSNINQVCDLGLSEEGLYQWGKYGHRAWADSSEKPITLFFKSSAWYPEEMRQALVEFIFLRVDDVIDGVLVTMARLLS